MAQVCLCDVWLMESCTHSEKEREKERERERERERVKVDQRTLAKQPCLLFMSVDWDCRDVHNFHCGNKKTFSKNKIMCLRQQ